MVYTMFMFIPAFAASITVSIPHPCHTIGLKKSFLTSSMVNLFYLKAKASI